MSAITTASIHPSIPTDRAWRDGRRIYVRSTYRSVLDAEIRQIGGRWDTQERALYVSASIVLVVTEIITRLQALAATQSSNGTAPRAPRRQRRSCVTGGNCSSFGNGRSCGAHDCDGH